jgi:hypothetical protein
VEEQVQLLIQEILQEEQDHHKVHHHKLDLVIEVLEGVEVELK